MIVTPKTHDSFELMLRGSLALARMHHNGMRIDTDYLTKAISRIDSKVAELQRALRADPIYQTWRKRFGSDTNLDSADQLGKVFFEELGYKPRALTATGKSQADEAAFKKINIPFVKNYFACSKLVNARDTWLRGIEREMTDGYIHPNNNLNIARTFRSSQDSPNCQNWPARDESVAKWVRRALIPRGKNRRIVENDFKGAEVKIAACYHKDPTMFLYLKDSSKDMHRDMAAQIYFLSEEEASKKGIRNVAKADFVFASFYGSYYIQTAARLWENGIEHKLPDGTTVEQRLQEHGIRRLGDLNPREEPASDTFEAHMKAVERDFWERRFRVYNQWKKDWVQQYYEKTWLEMLTGFQVRGHLSRNAIINYPIQGSSFHCLLWVITKMQAWLDKYKMKSRLIGQVHDSLIGDVHDDELQDYLNKVHELVTKGLPKKWPWIIVPLDVEAGVSPIEGSWYEKEEWVLKAGFWTPKNN